MSSRHVPIPQFIVKTLKALPSHGGHEYLFPSRPTARCPEPQRPYRWDLGKQFRALAKAAGIQNVRIHDLRHAGATILMTLVEFLTRWCGRSQDTAHASSSATST